MIDFKSKKVIFFDLDNTLFNTEENSHQSMQEMYDELNLGRLFPPFDEFWRVYHECNDIIWEDYRQHKITRQQLNEKRFSWPMSLMGVVDCNLDARITEVFYKYFLKKNGVLPYTYDVLDYLKSKYRLAILSNGTKESQIVKMENCDFNKYFEQMILSDDVGYRKPEAAIFQLAAEMMKVSLEDTIMIGDDLNADILGANNAQMDNIWLNVNNQPTENINPSYQIHSLSELKNLF